MSYISNYSSDSDSFLQCTGWNETATPFIAIVDRDVWGDAVHGVVHGHATPFNKLFTYGQDEAHAWAQREWGGCCALCFARALDRSLAESRDILTTCAH